MVRCFRSISLFHYGPAGNKNNMAPDREYWRGEGGVLINIMDPANQYPIIIKKKIPYVSELLLGIFSFCLIIIAICFFLFMPALTSSNEMKVISSIIIIPEYVKWLILSSGIG